MTRSSIAAAMLTSVAISFLACDSRPSAPTLPPDTVALVGGRPITRADLDRQLQRLPPAVREQYAQPARRAELLETIVGTELLVLEAERLGIHQDPEYQQAVKQLLVRHLLHYAVDPLPDHETRQRRMESLLAETRARFKVEILDPQLARAGTPDLVNTGRQRGNP